MYRFNTIQLTVAELSAFQVAKNVLTQQILTYFRRFEWPYLANGKSECIKPIHIQKVLNEDLTLKKTVFKNMQMEASDVMSKMAEFAQFCPKNAKISRMVHPILTKCTMFFILKSRSIRWLNSFW